MYGAALVATSTGEDKYRTVAERIADNLLTLQDGDGRFRVGDSLTEHLDQTAENVGWLREMYTELRLAE